MTRLKRPTGEVRVRSRSGTQAKEVFREERGSAKDGSKGSELREIRVKGGNLKAGKNLLVF